MATRTWTKWVGYGAAALAGAAAAGMAAGAWRWRTLTDELLARVEAARRPLPSSRVDYRELEGLPPIVQRYFRAVLTDGAPIVTGATLAHTGRFNMSETGQSWVPFHSTQHVVTQRPGFVWDARIRLMPGLAVHVHDAYIAGEGVLHPALLGLITLSEIRGTGEIAQGELMRFFAEAAWYPTALLPGQGVCWEAVDDRSARATLTDGPLSLTLSFSFDDEGLMTGVRAEARGRTVDGTAVPTPWEGRWRAYEVRSGMRVPTVGEVAWILADGRQPYWRGRLRSVTYTFAP